MIQYNQVLEDYLKDQIIQKVKQKMFFMKNNKVLMPDTQYYKIILKMNEQIFQYDINEFNEKKVQNKITQNELQDIIDEINKKVEYFRDIYVMKYILLNSHIILSVIIFLSSIMIILDKIQQDKQRVTYNIDQNGNFSLNDSLQISSLTIGSIFFIIFGIVFYTINLIILNKKTTEILQNYENLIKMYFQTINQNYTSQQIKFILGQQCLWIEIRLEFIISANTQSKISPEKRIKISDIQYSLQSVDELIQQKSIKTMNPQFKIQSN